MFALSEPIRIFDDNLKSARAWRQRWMLGKRDESLTWLKKDYIVQQDGFLHMSWHFDSVINSKRKVSILIIIDLPDWQVISIDLQVGRPYDNSMIIFIHNHLNSILIIINLLDWLWLELIYKLSYLMIIQW